MIGKQADFPELGRVAEPVIVEIRKVQETADLDCTRSDESEVREQESLLEKCPIFDRVALRQRTSRIDDGVDVLKVVVDSTEVIGRRSPDPSRS